METGMGTLQGEKTILESKISSLIEIEAEMYSNRF